MLNNSAEVLPSDHCWFQPVRQLLKDITLGAWLRLKPPSSVITLQASTTCGQALRTLAAAEISSAPLFDGNVYIGFITVHDILRTLLSIISLRDLTDDNREYKLRTAGLQLEHQQLRSLNIAQDGALIYKADLQSTLHDVMLYGFLQPDAAGYMQVVHRVGVFDADGDASDEDMASDLQQLQGISITHIISQSDIAHYLHKHIDELGPLAEATVQQLGLTGKAVVCVPGEMSAINAFASMVANKVSCVGVISHANGAGQLAASLSSSDLRGLLPEHFVALAAPVLHYLTLKASAGWAGQQQHVAAARPCSKPQPGHLAQLHGGEQQQHKHQQQQQQQQPELLQRQQSAGSAQAWGLKGCEGLKPYQLISCSPSSTLRQVLDLLASNRLHRLHVLDERSRPVGVISITDLMRLIVGATELLEAYGPDMELEQEVNQSTPSEPTDCSMGMDVGQELIEPHSGSLPVVNSQALLPTL